MTKRPVPGLADWRRQGQERFLKGRTWALQPFRTYKEGSDHDHCEFCWAKFSVAEGDRHLGYVTLDNYHWVCEECFADFHGEMEWKVANER